MSKLNWNRPIHRARALGKPLKTRKAKPKPPYKLVIEGANGVAPEHTGYTAGDCIMQVRGIYKSVSQSGDLIKLVTDFDYVYLAKLFVLGRRIDAVQLKKAFSFAQSKYQKLKRTYVSSHGR